jgi:hypothetical protein
VGIRRQRQPKVRIGEIGANEPRRSDAYYGELPAINCDGRTHHVSTAAEAAPPKTIAQDHAEHR